MKNKKQYHVQVWADEKEKVVFNLFEDFEEYKANLTIKQVKNLELENEPNNAIASLSRFFKKAVELKKSVIEKNKVIEGKDKRIAELEEELRVINEHGYQPIQKIELSQDDIKKLNNEMKIYLDIEKNVIYKYPEKTTQHPSNTLNLIKKLKEESNRCLRFNDASGNMSTCYYHIFQNGLGLFELIRNELGELDRAIKDKSYVPNISGVVFYEKLNGREVECLEEVFYIDPEEYKLPYSDGGYFRPTKKLKGADKI